MATASVRITEFMATAMAGDLDTDMATATEGTAMDMPVIIHSVGDSAVGDLVRSITPAAISDIRIHIPMASAQRVTTTPSQGQRAH